MEARLLQDYVTIRGAGTQAIIQSEGGWLDLSGYQDVVFWLEIKEYTVSGTTITVSFQTAANRDESSFVTIGSVAKDGTGSPGVSVTSVLKDSANSPLARWVRWTSQNSGASAWDITFRLWLTAARIGRGRVVPPTEAVPSARSFPTAPALAGTTRWYSPVPNTPMGKG